MKRRETTCDLSPKEARLVAAVASGAGTVASARQAGVSRSTASRWLQRDEIKAALAAARLEEEDVAARARKRAAERRAEALEELSDAAPSLARELLRRAMEEKGGAGVRACVEALRLAGLGVEPEDERTDQEVAGTIDANSSDEEVAARYLALVGGIRG